MSVLTRKMNQHSLFCSSDLNMEYSGGGGDHSGEVFPGSPGVYRKLSATQELPPLPSSSPPHPELRGSNSLKLSTLPHEILRKARSSGHETSGMAHASADSFIRFSFLSQVHRTRHPLSTVFPPILFRDLSTHYYLRNESRNGKEQVEEEQKL